MERSYSTPLIAGAGLLLLAIVFCSVPLVSCPRCKMTSAATGARCPICREKKKVSLLKQVRWQISLEEEKSWKR